MSDRAPADASARRERALAWMRDQTGNFPSGPLAIEESDAAEFLRIFDHRVATAGPAARRTQIAKVVLAEIRQRKWDQRPMREEGEGYGMPDPRPHLPDYRPTQVIQIVRGGSPGLGRRG